MKQSVYSVNKYRKKVGPKRQKLVMCATRTFEESIRAECDALNNYELPSSIGSTNFVAAEVHYHAICRSRFSITVADKVNKRQIGDESAWFKQREAHKVAFRALCEYVQENILKDEEIVSLSKLYLTYLDYLSANNFPNAEKTFLQHHLENKLFNKFGDDLCRDKVMKETIIYKSGLTITEAIKAQYILTYENSPEEFCVR